MSDHGKTKVYLDCFRIIEGLTCSCLQVVYDGRSSDLLVHQTAERQIKMKYTFKKCKVASDTRDVHDNIYLIYMT